MTREWYSYFLDSFCFVEFVNVKEVWKWFVPKLIALTKIVSSSMNMIKDALPSIAIILLTTCWPTRAATVATKTKYVAATKYQWSQRIHEKEFLSFFLSFGFWISGDRFLYHKELGIGSVSSTALLTWKMRTSLQKSMLHLPPDKRCKHLKTRLKWSIDYWDWNGKENSLQRCTCSTEPKIKCTWGGTPNSRKRGPKTKPPPSPSNPPTTPANMPKQQ